MIVDSSCVQGRKLKAYYEREIKCTKGERTLHNTNKLILIHRLFHQASPKAAVYACVYIYFIDSDLILSGVRNQS